MKEIWVLTVNYTYSHGLYSSRDKALRAARQYLSETLEYADEIQVYIEELQKSCDKGEEIFATNDNFISAEMWPIDGEFEDEDS